MNKTLFISYIIIFVFIISTVDSVQGSVAQSTLQNPGVFVGEVSALAPSPLDPATNYESQGDGFIRLMYEGLFQYANNSVTQLQSALATGYTVSPNGLIYTFHLRTGVQFSLQAGDSVGQPFNAYVMQYSIDRAILMNDPAGPAWMIDQWIKGANTVLGTSDLNQSQAITFLNQQSVKALNATTLQITLATPFSGFLQTLMYPVAFAVSPKAIIDNEPTKYTTKLDNTFGMVSLASFFPSVSNSSILKNLGLPSYYLIDNSGVVPSSPASGPNAFTWFQDHSAGTGPYYLVDLIKGQKVDLARNNNWWNSIHFQQHSVVKIQFIQVPEDATRVSDLKQSKIDSADIPISLLSQFGVTANHTTSTYSGISSYVSTTLNNEVIGMNFNDTLDKGQVVESSSSTYMKSNTTPLLKYNSKINGTYQYASVNNPFSALLFREAFANAFPYQQYISQAFNGFAIRMQGAIPQGILGFDRNLISSGYYPSTNFSKAITLFKQVGWQGTITLSYIQGSTARQISAQLLQNAIQSLNVGIKISVSAISWSYPYVTFPFDGKYALAQIGWTPDYADPQDYVVPYYQSGQTISGSFNYDNPKVDTLIAQAASTTSPSARTSIYHEIEQNASQDFPYIYLDQPQRIILARDYIQGINRSQTDSLNPITNTLSFQYLAKTNSIVNWSATYMFSGHETTPGFELFSTLCFFIIVVLLYYYKRKKEGNF